ncbi:DUF6862 domain-containing protein [Yoonia sp. R2-816]|uniref:DUF6862 domain-containing protein n=1 Tax=Yoonia sp. R2-816 TaxID=3342638 RepID=UPI003727FBC5
MAASTEEMVLTADGRLVLKTVSAGAGITANASDVEVNDRLIASGDIKLTAANDILVAADAQIVSDSAALLAAGGGISLSSNSEVVTAEQSELVASGRINLSDGARTVSRGDTSITAASLTAGSGAILAAGISDGEGGEKNDAALTTLLLDISGTARLAGAQAFAAGRFEITTEILDISSASSIDPTLFVASGDLDITASEVTATHAEARTDQNLTIANGTAAISIMGGAFQATQSATIAGSSLAFDSILTVTDGTATLNAVSGQLDVNGGIEAESLSVMAATNLVNTGILQGANSVILEAQSIENLGVVNAAIGSTVLQAQAITNSSTVFGATDVQIYADASVTNSGAVHSDGFVELGGQFGVASDSFTNTETGEIIATGDVALRSDDLINHGVLASSDAQLFIETAGDISNTSTGVIYGDILIQLNADGVIENTGGVILGGKDIVVAGLSGAYATRFTNNAAGLVESLGGDISLAAETIENIAEAPTITETSTTSTNSNRTGDCGGRERNCTTTTTTTSITTQSVVSEPGSPAQIISAGNITLAGTDAINAYSLISAQGDITLALNSLQNEGMDVNETTDVTRSVHRFKRDCWWITGWFCEVKRDSTRTTILPSVVTPIGPPIFSTIEAGGTIAGTVTGYVINGAVTDGTTPTTQREEGDKDYSPTAPGDASNRPLTGDISDLDSSAIGNPNLFVENTDPDADFLLETRFDFIDLDQFKSSDYFFVALGIDPESYATRLGDAYVETLFIREQLFDLTGTRLLEPGVDEAAQVQAMYDNAVDAAVALELVPGVALSPDQIAALTDDIVWLEETMVDGRMVLVPRVYLASSSSLERSQSGAQIAAFDVQVFIGEFTNTGAISTDGDLRLTVEGDLNNMGGTLFAGDTLFADVSGSLSSISGQLSGADVYLSARDVTIETAVNRSERDNGYQDGVAVQSSVAALNSLTIQADDTIALVGARLDAGSDVEILAGGDILVGALGLEGEVGSNLAPDLIVHDSVTHLIGFITAGNNLTIHSTGTDGGGDVTIEGAQLTAEETLSVVADQGSVGVFAVVDTSQDLIVSPKNSLFDENGVRVDAKYLDNTALQANLNAGVDVLIQAADAVAVVASDIEAGEDVALLAGGDILVGAIALESETFERYHNKSSGNGSAAGALAIASIVYGGKKEGSFSTESVDYATSSIAAGNNVTIQSTGANGIGDITIEGADIAARQYLSVVANQGDINLLAVADTHYTDAKFKSSGLFSKSETRDQSFTLTNQVTTLTGGVGINVLAAGAILAEGTEFMVPGVSDAVSGDDSLAADGLQLTSVYGDTVFTAVTDVQSSASYKKSSGFFGLLGSESDIRSLNTNAVGATADVGGDIGITSGGDLILTAVDFKADGSFSTDVAGSTTLLAAIDTSYTAVDTMNNNGVTIKTTTTTDYQESVSFNSIDAAGGVDFDDDSHVTLAGVRDPMIGSTHAASLVGAKGENLGVAALYLDPSDSDLSNDQSSGTSPDASDWRRDLDVVTAALPTGQDGNGYLYLDGLTSREGTTVDAITLIDDQFYEEDTVLNPAFKAALAIAVSAAIGNFTVVGQLGSLLGNSTTFGSALSTAVSTTATTTASAFVVESTAGVVTGDFDLDDIVKQAVTAGVTSGVTAGLTTGINLGEINPLSDTSWANTSAFQGVSFGEALTVNALLETTLDAGIRAGYAAKTNDDVNFGDAFLSGLQSDVTNMTMADLQMGIGDWAELNGGEGTIGHIALHAAVGCAAASALEGSCASGATAAGAQAVYAGILGDARDTMTETEETSAKQTAQLVGAFVGYATSGGEAVNVDNAANIAQSGLENNYLNHAEASALELMREDLADCAQTASCSEADIALLEQGIDRLETLDEARDTALRDACSSDPQGSACKGFVTEALLAAEYYASPESQLTGPQLSGYGILEQRLENGMEDHPRVDFAEDVYSHRDDIIALLSEFEATTLQTQQELAQGDGLAAGAALGAATLIAVGPQISAACLANPICRAGLAITESVDCASSSDPTCIAPGPTPTRTGPNVPLREADEVANIAPKTTVDPGTVYQVRLDPAHPGRPDPAFSVDTSTFTSGATTANGGTRNSRQFWNSWSNKSNNGLSQANQTAVANGRAPVVDDDWLRVFPEHSDFRGQQIVHHHMDYGQYAIPVPRGAHNNSPGFSIWHPPQGSE